MGDANSGLLWLGYVLSWLGVVILVADGLFQMFGRAIAPGPFNKMMELGEMKPELGFYSGAAGLLSGILYAIPETAVLGAIVATGFLGGAVAIDMRASGVGRPGQITSVVIGLIVWGGLYLLDERVRQLIPFVS